MVMAATRTSEREKNINLHVVCVFIQFFGFGFFHFSRAVAVENSRCSVYTIHSGDDKIHKGSTSDVIIKYSSVC